MRVTPHSSWLFTGDSITDAGRVRHAADDLGDGYVRRIAARGAASDERPTVRNTGVAGDRAVDLRARWEADAIAHGPTVLTVLVGVNDMWRRYDSDDPTPAEAFADHYRAILTRTRAALPDSRIVLMEPFLLPVTLEQERWLREDLREKQAITRALADQAGADFISLQSSLASHAETHGAARIAEDGVHPTAAGHDLIADRWWRTIGERA